MAPYPSKPLIALAAIVLFGTVYSVLANTYLDTSNPLLTHLPHPLHKSHYFASKTNVINTFFSKKIWAWTTLAFFSLYYTSPPSARYKERMYKYVAETLVWVLFTGWFFGPSLFSRVTMYTGGECVLHLPSGDVVTVPETYCYAKSTIAPQTHPSLFTSSFAVPMDNWSQVPRIRRGHDVSGHIFLITMSILFLVEQVRLSYFHLRATSDKTPHVWHKVALAFNVGVIVLAYFAAWTTSVYYHTPMEKVTGLGKSYTFLNLTFIPIENDA